MRILAVILSALVGLVSVAAAQNVKIGYVQIDRLMQNYPEHEDATKTFQKELDNWKAQLTEYQKQIDQMEQDFQQRAMLLSPEKQKEKQQQILDKKQEATKFYQDVFSDGGKAAQRREELWAPITAKINQAIEILGKRENYDMIFDSQGLLYAPDSLDITDQVLKILKAGVDSPSSTSSSH